MRILVPVAVWMCVLLGVSPAVAQTFAGSNLGAISDGSSTTQIERYGPPRDVTFAVSGTVGTVATVRVSFRAAHSFVGDLRVTLIAPNGKPHQLFARTGATTSSSAGATGNLVATNTYAFDDAFATNWWTAANTSFDVPSTNARTVVSGGSGVSSPPPTTSMNASFRGHAANGTWILRFEDRAGSDVGSVAAASLTLGMTGTTRVVQSASQGGGAGTLRQAMLDAGPGDLIVFDPNTFGRHQVIPLQSALPDITQDLAIQGPGAELLTVRRIEGAGEFRIFNVSSASAHVSLSGLTVSGGRIASFGGGIRSVGPLTLSRTHLVGNRADNGGGVSVTFSDATIIASTISGNVANFQAGGVRYLGDSGQRLQLISSTVSGNRAGSYPAGIYNAAIDGELSSLELLSCTVTDNVAGTRMGGIGAVASGSNSRAIVTLVNSIVAGNSPNNQSVRVEGGALAGSAVISSLGFNLSDHWNGLALQSTDRTAAPRLGPLAHHGGGTPTQMPLGGSPALDAGNRSGAAIDQRGLARVHDLSGIANASDGADIGAVEVAGLIVTSTSNGGAGSLREAVNAANANGPGIDDILFDPIVFGIARTIELTAALPDIATGLTINGPGADRLTLQRSLAAPEFRVLSITGGLPLVAIDGVTISKGSVPNGFGGGISSDSPLSLNEVGITGSASSSPGGGVFVGGADAWITRSAIYLNACTTNGAGVAFYGTGGHHLVVHTSTISGNRANGSGSGGGLLNVSFGGLSSVDILSSTIAYNRSAFGGAVQADTVGAGSFAFVTLRNSLIADNVPANFGNAAFAGGGLTNTDSGGFNLSDRADADRLRLPSDQNSATPDLGPLAFNGGPTPTHALGPASEARDGGSNSGSALLSDQRGPLFQRPRDLPLANVVGGDGTDIGAVEAGAEQVFADGFES